jgi:hypothetical protein
MSNAILARARRLVDSYKPLIEKEAGIDLGRVVLKDISEHIKDWREHNPSARWKETLGAKALHYLAGLVGYEGMQYSPGGETSFIYVNSRGIGSTVLTLRALDTVPLPFVGKMVGSTPNLEHIVVHELSHCLWNSLASKAVAPHKIPEVTVMNSFNEAFARYCERVQFAHLYTPGHEKIEESITFIEKSAYRLRGAPHLENVDGFFDSFARRLSREELFLLPGIIAKGILPVEQQLREEKAKKFKISCQFDMKERSQDITFKVVKTESVK